MKQINLQVAINSLGYGVVGYNVHQQLNQTEDVTLWPIGGQVQPPCEISEIGVQQIKIDIGKQNTFDPTLPFLKIWHENQLAERIGSGRYSALSFFEVNKFDDRRKSHLLSLDNIIVPSRWAGDIVFDQCHVKPAVVPMGVNRDIFNESFNTIQPHRCIFFNCGKWEVRKGHDILGEAFKDAFSNQTNVELWLMTENPFLNADERRYWENLYRGDRRIKIMSRVQYQEELAQIMSQVHCGVFPARAEGWNLELLELMSMGKQVITTNYSAHTEFCTEANARLISIVDEEPMFDGKWFTGDCGVWASLDDQPYDQLVTHLQDEYKSWVNDPTVLNTAGIETAENLTWNKTATRLLEIAAHD
ncbi:hypothetical protein DRN70_02845 [Methanosarcinales archaeon]|nr:MAG: hypothetical protein DRN70_02845 [Methanosarcinales archaeon]